MCRASDRLPGIEEPGGRAGWRSREDGHHHGSLRVGGAERFEVAASASSRSPVSSWWSTSRSSAPPSSRSPMAAGSRFSPQGWSSPSSAPGARVATSSGSASSASTAPADRLHQSLAEDPPVRPAGTGAYFYSEPRLVPPALLANLRLNDSLHEQVLVIAVVTEQVPRVHGVRRAEIEDLGLGFHQVTLHFGYMEKPRLRGWPTESSRSWEPRWTRSPTSSEGRPCASRPAQAWPRLGEHCSRSRPR